MILSTVVARPVQMPGVRIWQRWWSRSRMLSRNDFHRRVPVTLDDAVRGLFFQPFEGLDDVEERPGVLQAQLRTAAGAGVGDRAGKLQEAVDEDRLQLVQVFGQEQQVGRRMGVDLRAQVAVLCFAHRTR